MGGRAGWFGALGGLRGWMRVSSRWGRALPPTSPGPRRPGPWGAGPARGLPGPRGAWPRRPPCSRSSRRGGSSRPGGVWPAARRPLRGRERRGPAGGPRGARGARDTGNAGPQATSEAPGPATKKTGGGWGVGGGGGAWGKARPQRPPGQGQQLADRRANVPGMGYGSRARKRDAGASPRRRAESELGFVVLGSRRTESGCQAPRHPGGPLSCQGSEGLHAHSASVPRQGHPPPDRGDRGLFSALLPGNLAARGRPVPRPPSPLDGSSCVQRQAPGPSRTGSLGCGPQGSTETTWGWGPLRPCRSGPGPKVGPTRAAPKGSAHTRQTPWQHCRRLPKWEIRKGQGVGFGTLPGVGKARAVCAAGTG